MKKVIDFYNYLRTFPIYFLILINKKSEILWEELNYWGNLYGMPVNKKMKLLKNILYCYPEYRNLLEHRFRNLCNCNYSAFVLRILWKKQDSLIIFTKDIGKNLFIQHGIATIIAAKSIGDNCWINQQVTIGYTDNGAAPVIGNRVRISCGAKVLGNIKIEDDVIIGANAVVVKNVEKNQTVVGIPAKPIKHKNYNKY